MQVKVHSRECTVYDCNTFPYMHILDHTTYRKHKIEYLNCACAFDIETTTIRCPHMETCKAMSEGECNKECTSWKEPTAFMYQWQVALEDVVIFGRTWEEYMTFTNRLRSLLELSPKRRIVFYVHNLSFEFEFMKDFFDFDILATGSHKILTCHHNGIEYRCSYKLSNMSLEKFCENTPDCFFQKLTGQFDYNKIRYPSTPLSNTEMAYCYCDVAGLVECIRWLMKEDTIASIPLTNTGYVRRDCRKACSDKKNRMRFQREALTPEQYHMCREAFRGGDTHANYVYINELLTDMKSKDKASSYPYQMMSKKYPGKFIAGNPNRISDFIKQDYACLMTVEFHNLEYNRPEGMPYIPKAKSRLVENPVTDNGRIISAFSLEMTITEIDYQIIHEDYDIGSEIIKKLFVAKKSFLPLELRKTIMEYYELKTMLKDVDGKEYEYMKSKNRLNSIYGMMVTDMIRENWMYEEHEWKKIIPDIHEAVTSYYKNPNSFLSYQWGVWVTAYARRELKDMQHVLEDDMVYTDTDSWKYIGDHEEEFKEYNARILEEINSLDLKPVVYRDGVPYYMGIAEEDGEYSEFKTLGAKKYCYQKKGKPGYKTVVSGLGVAEGSAYINTHGINAFKPGTVFHPSGRLTGYHNECSIHYITHGTERILTASNIAMVPTTYTLDATKEYIQHLKKTVDSEH